MWPTLSTCQPHVLGGTHTYVYCGLQYAHARANAVWTDCVLACASLGFAFNVDWMQDGLSYSLYE